jgi:hypothetical protein
MRDAYAELRSRQNRYLRLIIVLGHDPAHPGEMQDATARTSPHTTASPGSSVLLQATADVPDEEEVVSMTMSTDTTGGASTAQVKMTATKAWVAAVLSAILAFLSSIATALGGRRPASTR